MIHRSFVVAWLVLFVAFIPVASGRAQLVAEVAPSSEFAGAIAETRAALREHTREQLPGLSIAVGIGGRVVWAEGFGWADLEQRVPVTTITRFRIGSVSKPMTAAAVGLLVQEGLLDLDAPVQEYVDSFPEKEHVLTTRLVAGHLAGIRHYKGDEFLSSRYFPTVTEGLAIFQDDPLESAPGERFSYSSYGWNLVSAVVEGASDEEFLSYMQRRVFDRLGLIHTVADQNALIVPGRARPYVTTPDGQLANAPYVDNSYKWAGGGFLSTPEDLVRFGLAHLGDGFLDAWAREILFTSQQTNDGEETGNGIGWFVGEEGGQKVVYHGGGSVGGTTRLALYPDSGLVFAMVSNLTSAALPDPQVIVQRFRRAAVASTAAGSRSR